MKKAFKKHYLYALAIVIALIAIIWTGYDFYRDHEAKSELTLFGNVDVRQVDIGFRVSGIVDKLFFEEGDLVRKGQLLAQLDKTPYDSQVRLSVANLAAAQANLDNDEKLFCRRKELILVGGVSQEDLDTSKANRDVAKANIAAADAQLSTALDNLSYTDAFAPNDGVILTRIREPGTVVEPSQPVYTLSLLSPIWIRAFVNEPDLGNVFYGMEAEIFTDTEGAPMYKGFVGFISPVAEFTPKTVETTKLRTDLVYRLRIYTENPDCRLKQGMPVTVKLKLQPRDACGRIPSPDQESDEDFYTEFASRS